MKGVALAAAGLGLRFGTFAASGADSYGYVSQADLWLERRLIIDEPLADEAPWPNANWTLTPFGYRPGDDRGTMVPTYAPGLPMVMAVFKAVGGADAVFYVVPLLGALAVCSPSSSAHASADRRRGSSPPPRSSSAHRSCFS